MGYKEDFVRFLVKSGALSFGEFKLKSGRIAPYFINTGMFSDGEKISKLGEYYAAGIKDSFGADYDGVFGPAYKGIPLSVAATIGLYKLGINKGYVFNRKLLKDYGQKDNVVGMKIDSNSRLVIVDDVITSGAAIRESLDFLKGHGNPKIEGIIVSVDRGEKGTGQKNALKEVAEDLGIKIYSIIKLKDIISVLHNKDIDGKVYIDDEMMHKISDYLKQYGAE
jgi:orotate phosphoribosyltransferase